MTQISERVAAHYRDLWGLPSRSAEFFPSHLSGRTIEVHKRGSSATGEGVAIYATLGVSDLELPGYPSTHRLEFYTGLEPELDDIVYPLAVLGGYPTEEHAEIAHSHTVSLGRALWPGAAIEAFLVIRPLDETIPSLVLDRHTQASRGSGIHVEFLCAIPVHASEIAFKQEVGVEGLLAQLRRKDVAFWDPHRAPEPMTRLARLAPVGKLSAS